MSRQPLFYNAVSIFLFPLRLSEIANGQSDESSLTVRRHDTSKFLFRFYYFRSTFDQLWCVKIARLRDVRQDAALFQPVSKRIPAKL